jgi:hypothetical protein
MAKMEVGRARDRLIGREGMHVSVVERCEMDSKLLSKYFRL